MADEEQIMAAIRRIIRAIDLQSRALVADIGLTGPQLAVMRTVLALGPVHHGAIARSLSASAPTVSGIVDRLQERGLVARTRDALDRRRVLVSLTQEGRAIVSAAPTGLQERFRLELVKLAQWERTSLLSALQRIAWMMNADQLEADPLLVTGPDPTTDPTTDTVES